MMRRIVPITILSALGLLAVALSVGHTQSITGPAATAPAAAYNTVAPTCTNGQFCFLQTDVNGNLKTTGAGSTTITGANAVASGADGNSNTVNALGTYSYNSVFNGTTWDRMRGDTTGTYVIGVPTTAAAAALTPQAGVTVNANFTFKASAGNMYWVQVTSGASAGFVMIFNATAAPADGAVTPLFCKAVAANSTIEMDFTKAPVRMSTGTTVSFSTTGCYSKTASATAFIAALVQ